MSCSAKVGGTLSKNGVTDMVICLKKLEFEQLKTCY